MKKLIVTFLVSAFFLSVNAQEKEFIAVKKLLENKEIGLEIRSIGGYQNECIRFSCKSNSKDTLLLKLELGTRLLSSDTAYQDILVLKSVYAEILPGDSLIFLARGFCCKSHHKVPSFGLIFTLGELERSWLPVLSYIEKQASLETSAVQSAVWVLSNNHPLATVVSKNATFTMKLRALLAKNKGVVLPWYNLDYKQESGTLFSDKAERVWGSLDYYVKNQAEVLIKLRYKKGKETLKILEDSGIHGPGTYAFNLDLNAEKLLPAVYEILVYADNQLISKKEFEIR